MVLNTFHFTCWGEREQTSSSAAAPQFSSPTQFTVGIAGFVSSGFALRAASLRGTGTLGPKALLAAEDWLGEMQHMQFKLAYIAAKQINKGAYSFQLGSMERNTTGSQQ